MNIDNWLRKEAEKLAIEADKVEKKLKEAMNNGSYDKIHDLNIKRRELNAQEIKLYELIGRLDEIKD